MVSGYHVKLNSGATHAFGIQNPIPSTIAQHPARPFYNLFHYLHAL
jgi:hypothetical protein